MKSVFFVPVFNQIEEFPNLLKEFAAGLLCDTLLLVNNGSNDGSEHLVRGSGYPHLDLPRNLGAGYSCIRAIEWALAGGYDVFGTIAANGKMLPSEMHRVLDPILRGEADFVVGSRFLQGGSSPNLPLFRRLTIPLVNGLVRVLFNARLTDATCGYRAFRLDIIRQAQFDWRAEWLYTYGFEYYLYAKVIGSRRFRCKEVPVTMRYPPRGRRYSKIKPFLDWYQMLKPWFVARFDGLDFAGDYNARQPKRTALPG